MRCNQFHHGGSDPLIIPRSLRRFLGMDPQQNLQDDSLSWDEARIRLRKVLEEFLDESGSNRRVRDQDPTNNFASSTNHSSSRIAVRRLSFAWCVQHDLDLYLGALSMSIVLLVLSCFSLTARRQSGDNASTTSPLHPSASLGVYRSQVAGSVLLTVGSLLSLWMVRRRRFLCLNDSDNAKRREVLRFLRNFDHETIEQLPTARRSSHPSEHSISSPEDKFKYKTDLPGTSLTDIYPVYRHCSSDNSNSNGSWSRIPSLLLVEGDLVALQVGDSTPADCQLVASVSKKEPSAAVSACFKAGQAISLDSVGRTSSQVVSHLPGGRITIPDASDHLLTLCNHINIYRVTSTPMRDFVRHPAGTWQMGSVAELIRFHARTLTHVFFLIWLGHSRASQMARRVTELRKALFIAGLVFLVLTGVITLSRPESTQNDLSLALPLPFLAALGVLPVVGPAFAFALEMLGTARILAAVHPHASLEKGGSNVVFPHTQLLLRYIAATILTRLSLWEAARRFNDCLARVRLSEPNAGHRYPLVRVPPASLNLLEKLGVATAFALIDDELACDPHAMPQQLLIPSAKGLKLLDLCPAFEGDSDVESDSDTAHGRKRGGSVESDSSEEATTHNYSSLRRKFLNPRYLKRRRSKDVTEATDTSSIDVQFEDPTWWQHLPTLKCIGLASLVMDDPQGGLQARNHSSGAVERHTESAKSSLLHLVCSERRSHQLQALAQCIGFSTEPNSFGERGDLSPFAERLRVHVLSRSLFQERLERDSHERSSEQSRWWGLLRPDATSVIVQDRRTSAHQLLTVGDPAVVMNLCNEAWQGEISTIIPLTHDTRRMVMETSNSWKLGDLDVAAFSYSPVSRTLETSIPGDDSPPSKVRISAKVILN